MQHFKMLPETAQHILAGCTLGRDWDAKSTQLKIQWARVLSKMTLVPVCLGFVHLLSIDTHESVSPIFQKNIHSGSMFAEL